MKAKLQCIMLLLSAAAVRARHLEISNPPPATTPVVTPYVKARQPDPITQASANNALCSPSPSPQNGIASEQALDRGVPYFLNDVITEDFLPNHGPSLEGWFKYFWTTFDDVSNPADPETSCTSFTDQCTPYAHCNDVMELFWNQNTIVNFRNYLVDFDAAFQKAVANVTLLLVKLDSDFPIINPITSLASLFNNIGAGLSVVGAGAGIVPGMEGAGGFLSMSGGVFSAVGANLPSSAPTDNLVSLSVRLSNVSTQVGLSNGRFLDAVIKRGDLSAYPERIYANSSYTIPLVAFFDNGKFLYPMFTTSEQRLDFESLISHQLLTTLAGTAILEANYFISTATYDVAHCPVGDKLTGLVIDNLCYTLEAPGSGQSTIASFQKQMDPDIVDKVETYYQISLSDIYTSSRACQKQTNVYSASVDFNRLDLTQSGIPPCFYSLPILEDLPCAITGANITGGTPKIGLTYLPDNLANIFTKHFCFPPAPVHPYKIRALDVPA